MGETFGLSALASDTVHDNQNNQCASKPYSTMMMIWSVLHQARLPPVMVNHALIQEL